MQCLGEAWLDLAGQLPVGHQHAQRPSGEPLCGHPTQRGIEVPQVAAGQPATPRRVGHQKSRPAIRPLRSYQLRYRRTPPLDQIGHPGPLCIGPGCINRPGIPIDRQDGRQIAGVDPSRVDLGRHAGPRPGLETRPVPKRQLTAGRRSDAGGPQGRLDGDGPRPAHRIDQRGGRIPPCGDQEAGGHRLPEGRFGGGLPPSPLVEGRPRRVDADREPVVHGPHHHQLVTGACYRRAQRLLEALGHRTVVPELGVAGGNPEPGGVPRTDPVVPVDLTDSTLQVWEGTDREASHPDQDPGGTT